MSLVPLPLPGDPCTVTQDGIETRDTAIYKFGLALLSGSIYSDGHTSIAYRHSNTQFVKKGGGGACVKMHKKYVPMDTVHCKSSQFENSTESRAFAASAECLI